MEVAKLKFVVLFTLVMGCQSLYALNTLDKNTNVNSISDLDWGVVLFNYYQDDNFNALIEHEYVEAIKNPQALSINGKVFKGGMQLSYGMPNEAKKIFDRLLKSNDNALEKNRAWFYLAKLFHFKSDKRNAAFALSKIKGEVPDDLHPEYHYISTLINEDGKNAKKTAQILKTLDRNNVHYPYLLFNLAVTQFRAKQYAPAIANFEQITEFAKNNDELAVLADRARHGLAQLSIQTNDMPAAWKYLKSIRTTGLYSNRALLTYSWTAIKFKQFQLAIPALQLLNQRSITIPEVQEAKVLLAHLYEQEGSPRKALESNLLAIKAFEDGVKKIDEARRIIAQQDVPREYIENLTAMMDDTDWYAMRPTVAYSKLTPFLIDLLASNSFNETLKELSDLYAIKRNLEYWSIQAREHILIMENTKKKTFDSEKREMIRKVSRLKNKLADQNTELRLYARTLSRKEQKRLKTLIDSTTSQLRLLEDKVNNLKSLNKPYSPPAHYKLQLANKHSKLKAHLRETNKYIAKLEPVVRSMVNAELNKHEERMKYYWAQSRLAKARLYDRHLMNLNTAPPKPKSGGKKPAKR